MNSRTEHEDAWLLAVDIGGTKCRVRLAKGYPGKIEELDESLRSQEHDESLNSLKAHLEAVMDKISDRELAAVTVAAAGPVEGGVVTLTNWEGHPRLAVKGIPAEAADEDAAGQKASGTVEPSALDGEVEVDETLEFPVGHNCVALVNDLEAAVYGLVEAWDEQDPACPECQALVEPQRARSGEEDDFGSNSRLVLIMPGTGLGTAALMRTKDKAGNELFTAVPSEMQHSEIPALDEAHARLIERWKATTGARRLRWEDFVSGDGLVMIYRLLGGVAGLDASGIAERVPDEIDRASVEALELYYRCVARYAQLAALAYQPTHGVFLGGDTTRKNQEFLCDDNRKKAFRWEFYDISSPVHLKELEEVPIKLVLEELVLRGGLWLAQRAWKHSGVPADLGSSLAS